MSILPQTPSRVKNISITISTLIVLIVLYTLLSQAARWWIHASWFSLLGYQQVFQTNMLYKTLGLIITAVFYFLPLCIVSLVIYKLRDEDTMHKTQDALGGYRKFLARFPKATFIVPPLLIALFMTWKNSNCWETYLLWKNHTNFDIHDPQFHKDLSFYVFTLPWLRLIGSYLLQLCIFAFIFTVIGFYIYGGINLQGTRVFNRNSRLMLSWWISLFLLIKAYSYWLDRFELLYSEKKPVLNGATYTIINALMPAKLILLVLCLISIGIMVIAFMRQDFRIAAFTIATLMISAFIFSIIWPVTMEKFTVKPNEINKELTYIQRNIDATEYAYGLRSTAQGGKVQIVNNWPNTDSVAEKKSANGASDQIAIDSSTANYIRIMDPDIVAQEFTKLKGERQYYAFPPHLASDRYTINGRLMSLLVGARELNTAKLDREHKSWTNEHLVFTHGDGFFAASSTVINGSSNPDVGGDPLFYTPKNPSDPLYTDNPRIYFGPIIGSNPHDYSIVSNDGIKREWDSPRDRYSYTGRGIPIGTWPKRIAMSLVDHNWNFILSKELDSHSQLLSIRDPRRRVHTLAPWLMIDPETYPVVVNHHILWVVDAYTVLQNLPYVQHIPNMLLTAFGLHDVPWTNGTRGLSYIRNSVKATVDAYTGEVNLYQVDQHDPVLGSWEKIYPHLIKNIDQAPAELKQHFRYPRGLFALQRYLLQSYHGSTLADFFQQTDEWSLPINEDPNQPNKPAKIQDPYYFVAADPRTGKPSFQLGTVMLSSDQSSISAVVSVSNDPRTYGQMTLRLVKDQSAKGFPSPALAISKALQTTLGNDKFRELTGMQPIYGTILAIALSTGNILYIEPIYLQSPANESVSLYKVLLYTTQRSSHNIGYGNDTLSALKMMGLNSVDNGPFIPITVNRPNIANSGIPATLQDSALAIQVAITAVEKAQKGGNLAEFFKSLAILDHAIQQWNILTGQQKDSSPAENIPDIHSHAENSDKHIPKSTPPEPTKK